jgi:micrococcal nuclease
MNFKENKRIILFFFIILILFSYAYYSENKAERVKIIEVIDGDTIKTQDDRIIRLIGINSPEKEQECYEQAKKELKEFVLNKTVKIKTDKKTGDKDRYGRILRYVFTDKLVNEHLILSGNSYYYDYSDFKYKKRFEKAEKEAKKGNGCLWKFSKNVCIQITDFRYDAEGDDRENLNNEYVVLKNVCSYELNMENWKIKDEANKEYILKVFLAPNSKIILHTGTGKDNETDIFWNKNTPVWNNDRDTLYLRNQKNEIVVIESY